MEGKLDDRRADGDGKSLGRRGQDSNCRLVDCRWRVEKKCPAYFGAIAVGAGL